MRKHFLNLACVLVFVCNPAAQAQPTFYGMAVKGGSHSLGTIFSINPSTGSFQNLWNFDSTNGATPRGCLLQAADGKLYGLTSRGGFHNNGVLFSYDTAIATFTKLFDFNSSSGAYPLGSLIQATDGNLYGMTSEGGVYSSGVIFSFDLGTTAYKRLWDFNSQTGDGINPQSSLLQAMDGKLYGVTAYGGENDGGVIFSFDPTTLAYKVVRSFSFYEDGGHPVGSLIQASDGKLYGMTRDGVVGPGGTIFSLDPATGTYSHLWIFSGGEDFLNGTTPLGDLLQASDGLLYGLANRGGARDQGTLFSFNPLTTRFKKLQNFYGKIGGYPTGSLTQGPDGKLYGTTSKGGLNRAGVVFSFDLTTARYKKLRDFDSTSGIAPAGTLTAHRPPCKQTWYYQDKDGDGFGNVRVFHAACIQPEGYVTNKADCNDNYATVHPGAIEVCNGLDDDCNGLVDDSIDVNEDGKVDKKDACDLSTVWYRDADGDGWGDPTLIRTSAIKPRGYVKNNRDCNDKNKVKGGSEVCDGQDNDCDGIIDNGLEAHTYYSDWDGDGYGSEKRIATACAAPPRYIAKAGDLNDDNATVYPGAPELCDGRDNDCNGKIDDGLPLKPFYWDADKDGYGFFRPVYACVAPRGYIAIGGDFNDHDASIYPGATEHCDGVDEDCDGVIDNGFVQKRFYKDRDGDGWGSNSNLLAGCAPKGYVERTGDCNDQDPNIQPHAAEGPNNTIDDNCNGLVDEPTAVDTLYGMTPFGGAHGEGTIFSFNPTHPKLKKLWDFGGGNLDRARNGSQPFGSLTQGLDGKLYGMTVWGGTRNAGVIFSFDPATFKYRKVWDFDGIHGGNPAGTLKRATNGKFYGLALGGRNDVGVLFSFDPATRTYARLWDFDSASGSYPARGLMQASDGKLYGMTTLGGAHNAGVIFSYDPATGTYKKGFDFKEITVDGLQGSLVQAADGKLYGIGLYGGEGYGTIFSFDPATRAFKQVGQFSGTAENGAYSYGGLLQASDGKLYGTTSYGGTNFYGVLFSFDPAAAIVNKRVDFNDATGAYAYGSLIQASNGALYGMTQFGGTFSFDPVIGVFTKLFDIGGTNGKQPYGELVEYRLDCNQTTYYQDQDGDGYGDAAVSFNSCTQLKGYVQKKGDCNDADAAIHPGASDRTCNGKDNNCNSLIDEDGDCRGMLTKANKNAAIQDVPSLRLSAAPNPTRHYFNLRIESNTSRLIQLRVVDAIGRTVEVRQGVAPNSTVFIGHNYRAGVYYARAFQEGKHVTIKLIKQSP